MRKKRGRNSRRGGLIRGCFGRRTRREDETDWVILDDTIATTVRRGMRSRRVVRLCTRIAVLAFLGFLLPPLAKKAHEAIFFENEEFVLKRIVMRTDGDLSERQLLEVANVSVGMNLMELDLDGIRRRVEMLPMVEEVVVLRELPDRIDIAVKEREPVAWMSCPPLGIRPGDMERGFLVDKNGVLFRCLDLNDKVAGLPLIESFRMSEPVEGEPLETEGLAGAIRVIEGLASLNAREGMEVHIVRLQSEWSLVCQYRSGLEVTFNLHEVERGLDDLSAILDGISASDAALATVNVAARDNIPVTFATPPSPEAIAGIARPLEPGEEEDAPEPEDPQQTHLRSILRGG